MRGDHHLRRRLIAVFAFYVFGAGSVNAADLLAVYRQAQDSDPSFQSAQFAFESAKQKVPEAISSLLPSIGASATDGRTVGDTAYTGTPEVGRGFFTYTWAIQLTQPIVRPQSIMAFDEARSLAAQATAQFAQAKEDLILRVSQAYFDVLVSKEGKRAADAQLKSTREQLAAARHGYDDGTSAITDVHEAKSHAELAQSQQIAALNDLETKRAELERVAGPVGDALAALKPDLVAPSPEPNDVGTWIARAKQDNPGVQAQKAAFAAAQAEVARVRLQRAPTIDLLASFGRNYSSGNINNPDDYATRASDKQIGMQFSMPLLDGGGIHAQVLEAKANSNKAAADLEAISRQSGAQAREAYSGIVNGLAQIKALDAAVQASESSVTGNGVGYRLGIRINSDVLDAEQQLYSARRDLAKARYDTLMQGLKLKAAVGSLSELDLVIVNSLLIEQSDESDDHADLGPAVIESNGR